jgi:hypothetical protein
MAQVVFSNPVGTRPHRSVRQGQVAGERVLVHADLDDPGREGAVAASTGGGPSPELQQACELPGVAVIPRS